MNIFVGVLFAIASTVPAYVTPRNKFEEGVLKIIEKVKTGDVGSLPWPLTSLSLSPVVIPPSITTDGEGHTLTLAEGEVYGLEDIFVDKLSTFESWILIDLFVPKLRFQADYTLQSEAIFGLLRYLDDKGIFRCQVSDLKVWADVQFGTRNTSTVISYLDIHFVIGDMQVNLSNSMEMVNEKIRAKILRMMFSNETKENVQKLIKKRFRSYLRGRTLDEFKDIIASV